eukprot:255-Heterococcus_DN1.PRE.1
MASKLQRAQQQMDVLGAQPGRVLHIDRRSLAQLKHCDVTPAAAASAKTTIDNAEWEILCSHHRRSAYTVTPSSAIIVELECR